jgi:hypothetical protein
MLARYGSMAAAVQRRNDDSAQMLQRSASTVVR